MINTLKKGHFYHAGFFLAIASFKIQSVLECFCFGIVLQNYTANGSPESPMECGQG